MYVEERMYTLRAGTAPEYLKYYTEVGTLNMIVHMWAYESLDQRERCRAAMSADPSPDGAPGDAHHEVRAVLRRTTEEDACGS